MIERVTVRHFKLFKEQVFDLGEYIVLAGPNNSGKTSLLQAIVVWNLALQRWRTQRKPDARGKQRAAIPITRKDFTAIPLREMNLLWKDTSTALRKHEVPNGAAGQPRVLEIKLEGVVEKARWDLTFEFRYQSSEQIYARPSEQSLDSLPAAVDDFRIAHVPPFSGIGVQETRYDEPYQNLLIGQGKPGDILRNLLLEIYERKDDWDLLVRQVEEIFNFTLLPPRYGGLPFIVCEYLPGIPQGRGRGGLPPLDISSGGSGFHQVLMLLAFFYARPSTVLLLDEPDAHLHVVLQKQIYDLLRRVSVERGCQLVMATHSEVLIDGTSPEAVLSFLGEPHRLVEPFDRSRLREAHKRLSAMDLLLAEQARAILYLEGETDYNLLRAWATVLDHPVRTWLSGRPFWHRLQGRNPREARGHFFSLKSIRPDMRGVLVLDGDNRRLPDREVSADGLTIIRWPRYEAESYLLHPEALFRYIEKRAGPIFSSPAREYLEDQLPPAVHRDPHGAHEFLVATPASKSLLPDLFQRAGLNLSKKDYYLVAEQMNPDEIPRDVVDVLDLIASAVDIG